MVQNLTQDNFFNELHDAYPQAVAYFWEWFYKYQKEVGWHDLFGDKVINNVVEPYRFTDIPFEMQNGIMARFELELFNNTKGRGREEYFVLAEKYKDQMRLIFADLQQQYEKLKNHIEKLNQQHPK